ncbi:MAG: carbohydrate binding family 9 domain-containing protein [Imperialibacter sp.]|uniref:carbohydrate binding family 9 domain-containing protein n=1 Tax=Imperialibacter sp. TaxID=2038411 RepID=UPI0032EC07E6
MFKLDRKELLPLGCFLLIFLFSPRLVSASGSGKNEFATKRITSSPKVDGILDEDIWSQSPTPTQFTQFKPNNGEKSNFLTAVELVYDDNALYLSARLYDPNPSEIRREFGKRDDFNRNTDWFGILVDPYNSGQNAFSFFVSAAGVQGDYFINGDNWDENWDAVWESAIAYDDHGWTVE